MISKSINMLNSNNSYKIMVKAVSIVKKELCFECILLNNCSKPCQTYDCKIADIYSKEMEGLRNDH